MPRTLVHVAFVVLPAIAILAVACSESTSPSSCAPSDVNACKGTFRSDTCTCTADGELDGAPSNDGAVKDAGSGGKDAPAAFDAGCEKPFDAGTETVSGTVGGNVFKLVSGVAFRVAPSSAAPNAGFELYFSDLPDLCAQVGKAARNGETIVSVPDSWISTPGWYESTEAEMLVCPKGANPSGKYSYIAGVSSGNASLTSVTQNEVSGSVQLFFPGGTVRGAFTVPICAENPGTLKGCL